MLHKCATKDCHRKFKYFGIGLLYVQARKTQNSTEQDLEFFWLCERCARVENEAVLKRLPVVIGPALRRTA